MPRRPPAALLLLLLLAAGLPAAAAQKSKTSRPGRESAGVTLLPNGWRIAPAGRHITVGDLPLAMAESPDGRTLVVSNNGYSKPTLSRGRPEDLRRPAEARGGERLAGPRLAPGRQAALRLGRRRQHGRGVPARRTRGSRPGASFKLEKPADASFVGGLAIAPDGSRLFAVHALGELLSAVDLGTGEVVKKVELPAEGYTALVTPDGKTVLVSLWGGAKVLLFDAATLAPQGRSRWGSIPTPWPCPRTAAGSSWPAPTPTRSGWSTSPRGRRRSRSRSPSIRPRRRAARPTAWGSRRTAARCWWRTRTTTRSPWWTSPVPAPPPCGASSRPAGIPRRRCSAATAGGSSSSAARG